jgi:hypothetical protein
MGLAYINLEDMEDGSIAVQVVYKNGFDLKSNAHQHAGLIIKWLDENLTKIHEPVFHSGEVDDSAKAGYAG